MSFLLFFSSAETAVSIGRDVAPCTCVYLSAGSRRDWQMVIEALMDKDNERILPNIFLRGPMYEDTSYCTILEQREGQRKQQREVNSKERVS